MTGQWYCDERKGMVQSAWEIQGVRHKKTGRKGR